MIYWWGQGLLTRKEILASKFNKWTNWWCKKSYIGRSCTIVIRQSRPNKKTPSRCSSIWPVWMTKSAKIWYILNSKEMCKLTMRLKCKLRQGFRKWALTLRISFTLSPTPITYSRFFISRQVTRRRLKKMKGLGRQSTSLKIDRMKQLGNFTHCKK